MAARTEHAKALAAQLRKLRKEAWPAKSVTQQHLAKALKVSVPLISSWENVDTPTVPSEEWLRCYALFFATERSMNDGKSRLLKLEELEPAELARHHKLTDELKRLREAAVGPGPDRMSHTAPAGDGLWRFRDGAPITIICAKLPPRLWANDSFTNPQSPDYAELNSYGDLDALIELHGHIRAANPDSHVTFGLAEAATRDQLTTHLVVLGGVDWNPITREVLEVLRVPVAQRHREEDSDEGAFETDDGEQQVFPPALRTEKGSKVLIEDVAHFFRGPNPFNRKRTVTICNGMFGRGVYGAVRALTDTRFRDRNAEYIHSRFPAGQAFSILTRVLVIAGEVITPDWTQPDNVLHQWSGPVG